MPWSVFQRLPSRCVASCGRSCAGVCPVFAVEGEGLAGSTASERAARVFVDRPLKRRLQIPGLRSPLSTNRSHLPGRRARDPRRPHLLPCRASYCRVVQGKGCHALRGQGRSFPPASRTLRVRRPAPLVCF